jgi:hypothetical protein
LSDAVAFSAGFKTSGVVTDVRVMRLRLSTSSAADALRDHFQAHGLLAWVEHGTIVSVFDAADGLRSDQVRVGHLLDEWSQGTATPAADVVRLRD